MSNNHRFVAIDAWRFIFALLIIWHHLPWIDGHVHWLGYCAVSFFFIASGFFSAHSDTSDLQKFYLRKFFRIFPIYWIALAVALLIEAAPVRYIWTSHSVWDILQHVFLLQAYSNFETHPMFYYLNGPTWFLCVLVLFYAVLPLLQHWQHKFPKWFAIGVIVYSLCAIAVTWLGFDGAYWVRVNMPLVRISECLFGMVLAHWLQDKNISGVHKYISVGVLVLFFIFAYDLPTEYIRPYMSIPMMAYLLVAFLSCKENKALIYISKMGGVSMEMYIFHHLVIVGLKLVEYMVHYTPPIWLNICLVYGLTLLIAILYQHYITPCVNSLEQKVISRL